MGTTPGGTPYADTTDTLPDWPATSEDVAQRVDVVAGGSMVRKTADYTVTVADILSGKTLFVVSASAKVITLPSSSLVNGMTVRVVQGGAGGVSFTGGTLLGSITTLSAPNTGMSLVYDSTESKWWCLPFSGSLPRPVASGGTETTLTNPDGDGKNYKLHTFTSNGTLTVTVGGWVQPPVVVGGGGGGQGGSFPYSGGGGDVRPGGSATALYWLPAGTHTVVVGAGGTSSGTNGGRSSLGTIASAGGGIGNKDNAVQQRAAGGMSSNGSSTNTGAGGAGGDGSAGVAGPGITSSITGSAVEYGKGGLKNVNPSLPGQGAKEGANAGNAGVVHVRYEI